MSYSIQGKDIIVAGFEKGIADSPHEGIADMRNANIISVPGEASVNFKTAAMTIPPTVSAVAFTVGTDDVFTVASTTGYYNGMAFTLNSLVNGTGLATGRVYWMGDVTSTTFKAYKNPSLAAGAVVNVTLAGSGTYSSYTLAAPLDKTIIYDNAQTYEYEFILDSNGLLWWIYNVGGTLTNYLVYLGNDTVTGTTGRAVSSIANYIIVFRTSTTDYLNVTTFATGSTIDLDTGSGWVYGWEGVGSVNTDLRSTLSAQDNALYYGGNSRVGSFLVNAGSNFDPADTGTYTQNVSALNLPDGEVVISLGELGTDLLVGGLKNLVYPWDRVSTSYTYPLILPENTTFRIVSTNSNAYLFAGNRGRIYITNGTNINLWKKVPDYLTGVIDPYIVWGDASYWKNQVYFSFTAKSNAGAALDNTAGLWAMDIETEALRLSNQLSYGAYTGSVSVILPNVLTTTPGGAGLYAGWTNSSTYGVDYGSTAPYSSYETYIDSDLIPVGTYLKPFTPSQVEWKTSYPIGVNGTAESIRIQYRTNLSESWTTIGTTTVTGTSMVGSTTGTTTLASGQSAVSDYYQTNFQKAQWIQLRVLMSSNATTPTYNRLTEIRIREWPNADQDK